MQSTVDMETAALQPMHAAVSWLTSYERWLLHGLRRTRWDEMQMQ